MEHSLSMYGDMFFGNGEFILDLLEYTTSVFCSYLIIGNAMKRLWCLSAE